MILPGPDYPKDQLLTVEVVDSSRTVRLWGDGSLEVSLKLPDRRGSIRTGLDHVLNQSTSGMGVSGPPEAGRGTHPAPHRQLGIPTLIEIRGEDKLHVSGCQKVPSRGRTITPHRGEHPALDLAGLDRHEHVAD